MKKICMSIGNEIPYWESKYYFEPFHNFERKKVTNLPKKKYNSIKEVRQAMELILKEESACIVLDSIN